MPTRPRLRSAVKQYATQPMITAYIAVLCSDVPPPQRVRGKIPPDQFAGMQAAKPVKREHVLLAGAQGRGGGRSGGNGGKRSRSRRGRDGRGGRGTQGASESCQGQPFNGSDGSFVRQFRPLTKRYRCAQPGHRHNECTPTITSNLCGPFGQGKTAVVARPPPLPSSAEVSTSTPTMVPMFSPSPSGGHQHPQQFMAC